MLCIPVCLARLSLADTIAWLRSYRLRLSKWQALGYGVISVALLPPRLTSYLSGLTMFTRTVYRRSLPL